MKWSQTRRKLLKLASGRSTAQRPTYLGNGAAVEAGPPSEGEADPESTAEEDPELELARESPPAEESAVEVRGSSLCIASGKGGTGKSVVSASLASLFSAHGRTLVVDADMGVGNAHILQDVSPTRSFVDVVEGRCTVRDVVVPCSEEVDLLAAGSGVPRLAELSSFETHLIATGLEELEHDYRFLLVDSAAGVSRQTVRFACACDVVLIVTTPDLTAMTDAYAFLKVLAGREPERPALLLVNRAHDEEEAQEVATRIGGVCRRFLGAAPRSIGWLPEDRTVAECVNRRGPVVELEPEAAASSALRRVSATILAELARNDPGGLGRRLLDDVGYPAHYA